MLHGFGTRDRDGQSGGSARRDLVYCLSYSVAVILVRLRDIDTCPLVSFLRVNFYHMQTYRRVVKRRTFCVALADASQPRGDVTVTAIASTTAMK